MNKETTKITLDNDGDIIELFYKDKFNSVKYERFWLKAVKFDGKEPVYDEAIPDAKRILEHIAISNYSVFCSWLKVEDSFGFLQKALCEDLREKPDIKKAEIHFDIMRHYEDVYSYFVTTLFAMARIYYYYNMESPHSINKINKGHVESMLRIGKLHKRPDYRRDLEDIFKIRHTVQHYWRPAIRFNEEGKYFVSRDIEEHALWTDISNLEEHKLELMQNQVKRHKDFVFLLLEEVWKWLYVESDEFFLRLKIDFIAKKKAIAAFDYTSIRSALDEYYIGFNTLASAMAPSGTFSILDWFPKLDEVPEVHNLHTDDSKEED